MSHMRPCHECRVPCRGLWLKSDGEPLCTLCARIWPCMRAPEPPPPPPKPAKPPPVHQVPLAPVEPRVGRRAMREVRAGLRAIVEKYRVKRGGRG